MRSAFALVLSALFCCPIVAQPRIISGPMLGPVELRDAKVWVEVSREVKSLSLEYNKKGERPVHTIHYRGELGKEFNPICFTIGGLHFNTTYEYRIRINGLPAFARGQFTTKDLWQWRKPAPDFSFLTGSCSYFNEPVFDRPGASYGKDSSIFETMAREQAAFMLWLGDAWYTREVDFFSEWGLWYRAHRDRSVPVLRNFLKAMPQVAIWDDHDYGPNNIGSNYVLKDVSRRIWQSYWCNPSYGENGQGVYTMMSWGDVDLFLTDGRWWRSPDREKDSVDGRPNPGKTMFGRQQLQWLKNSLLYSNAPFKIIVVGSQVLNPVSPYDRLRAFSVEYQELMSFLETNRISGVVFLTGDRHHSEIIRVNRPGNYPLFDITVSPLTSSTHSFGGPEKENPYRVLGIPEKQNYAKFSFSGPRGERRLTVRFFGIKGEQLGEWSVSEKELKVPAN